LKDMLSVNDSQEKTQAKQLDSTRFAMLDNELQNLRKMLLEAMLQKSEDSTKRAQERIEAELVEREREKASRDSLIAEKIAALDAVQADLNALEAEASSGMDTKTIMIAALAIVVVALGAMMLLQKRSAPQQGYPPMPPYPYPPPHRRRRKKKKKPAPAKEPEEEKEKKESEEEKEAEELVTTEETFEKDENGTPVDNVNDGDNLSVNDDPNVLKSEIDDIRKSIVSMSVGQPGRTSTIVKEWLEQPAPEAPAVEEAPAEEEAGESEEEKSE
jgi:hypothetical protein